MTKSNLTLDVCSLVSRTQEAKRQGNPIIAFDWDKAAQIIKREYEKHPDLIAEAGLMEDWHSTGGVIFEDGKPTNEHDTYLSSNWAKPTLILFFNDVQKEVECFTGKSERFNSDTKWDENSLEILGINLPEQKLKNEPTKNSN